MLAMALLIMLMVTVFVYLWPDYAYSVRKQRSDNYWQNANPLSIRSNFMYPDQPVLEIRNNEPVSLTVTKLWVDRAPLNFYNHTIPFTWIGHDRCGGGGGICSMSIRPGETQIVSTDNYTTSPPNPCLVGNSFMPGLDYEADFAMTYYASDPNSLENESGKFPLMGKCTAR